MDGRTIEMRCERRDGKVDSRLLDDYGTREKMRDEKIV